MPTKKLENNTPDSSQIAVYYLTVGHFRQMVNLAIIFKSLANGYNYGTIFKIHVCINWNYIEYIIMIA